MRSKLLVLISLFTLLISCDNELIYPSKQGGEAPISPEGIISKDFVVKEIPADMILKYNMDPGYYAKYTTAWGIPIVGPNEVEDIYLKNAAELVVDMLSDDNLRPEIAVEVRNLLFQNMMRISIYPDNGKLTSQVPEFKMFDAVSGYGAVPGENPVMTMGITEVKECDENLFSEDYGRGKRGNTLPHEIMHCIHAMAADALIPGFTAKLKEAYQNAQNLKIWDAGYAPDGTKLNNYINEDYKEYLAEGTEVWFNWQPYPNVQNDIFAKQKDLKIRDPKLYEVISLIFQPNEDAMEHLSFASPKVVISITNLVEFFGYESEELLFELFGGNKVIRSSKHSVFSQPNFIFPDPNVSYISYDQYTLKVTVIHNSGEKLIKEYSFSKEELSAMKGFPSNIHLSAEKLWGESNL